METVNQKTCPFKSDYRNEIPFCDKEQCGVWDANWNQCGMLSMKDAIMTVVGAMRGEK